MNDKKELLRELLAEAQHEIWSHWVRYLFSKCDNGVPRSLSYIDDDSLIIPGELVRRWVRQIKKPYFALTPKEREFDRDQADKVLLVIDNFMNDEMEPA